MGKVMRERDIFCPHHVLYRIKLSSAASYRGAITRIRYAPIPAGSDGEWIKLRSIGFAKTDRKCLPVVTNL